MALPALIYYQHYQLIVWENFIWLKKHTYRTMAYILPYLPSDGVDCSLHSSGVHHCLRQSCTLTIDTRLNAGGVGLLEQTSCCRFEPVLWSSCRCVPDPSPKSYGDGSYVQKDGDSHSRQGTLPACQNARFEATLRRARRDVAGVSAANAEKEGATIADMNASCVAQMSVSFLSQSRLIGRPAARSASPWAKNSCVTRADQFSDSGKGLPGLPRSAQCTSIDRAVVRFAGGQSDTSVPSTATLPEKSETTSACDAISVASIIAIIVRLKNLHSSGGKCERKSWSSLRKSRKASAACMFSFTLLSLYVIAALVAVFTMYALPYPG